MSAAPVLASPAPIVISINRGEMLSLLAAVLDARRKCKRRGGENEGQYERRLAQITKLETKLLAIWNETALPPLRQSPIAKPPV